MEKGLQESYYVQVPLAMNRSRKISSCKLLLIFVCLFFVFSSLERTFHSYGDVATDDEGLQILNYARPSPRTRDTYIFDRTFFSFSVELSLPVFTTQACSGQDSYILPSTYETNALINPLRHRRGYISCKISTSQ